MSDDHAEAHEAPDDRAVDSGLPGILGVVDRGVAWVEAVLLAFGVILMAVNTVANVVGRFVFGQSLFFSEEVNRILIILITFAGLSYAARQGRHIRMSAIYDALPKAVRKPLMIVSAFVTALFMFGLCWYALQYIIAQAGRGRVLPALSIPVWWSLVWVPVGFFMTGLQYLLTGIKNLSDPRVWLSTSTTDGYDDEPSEGAL